MILTMMARITLSGQTCQQFHTTILLVLLMTPIRQGLQTIGRTVAAFVSCQQTHRLWFSLVSSQPVKTNKTPLRWHFVSHSRFSVWAQFGGIMSIAIRSHAIHENK